MSDALPDPRRPVEGPEIIAICSYEQEVGKSTAAVNLALGLVAAGRTVLLLDMDQRSRIEQVFVRNRVDVAQASQLLEQACIQRDMITATEVADLYLIHADAALDQVEKDINLMGDNRTRLRQALARLDTTAPNFDHVVINCPPVPGLLALNAITAAHRILLSMRCDDKSLNSLPDTLKIISRLRAGINQPLYGVHALINVRDNHRTEDEIADALHEQFDSYILDTSIPFDPAAIEARNQDKPLLAYCLGCPASQAYLDLTVEWILLGEPAVHTQSKARKGKGKGKGRQLSQDPRVKHHRDTAQKRVRAWLVDPTSLLYDAAEVSDHDEQKVLEELFQLTQANVPPPAKPRQARHKTWYPILLLALLAAPAYYSYQWFQDSEHYWRTELGARVIGTSNFWTAGSLLLSRADEQAYRELLLAAQIVQDNRQRLLECHEEDQVPTHDSLLCTLELRRNP